MESLKPVPSKFLVVERSTWVNGLKISWMKCREIRLESVFVNRLQRLRLNFLMIDPDESTEPITFIQDWRFFQDVETTSIKASWGFHLEPHCQINDLASLEVAMSFVDFKNGSTATGPNPDRFCWTGRWLSDAHGKNRPQKFKFLP